MALRLEKILPRGRCTPFHAWLVLLSAAIALGLYAAIIILFVEGREALGTTDHVPWGILISTYVFFVLTSTGLCFISSFGHVFGVKRYELIGKRGVFLAIITILAGFFALAMELGHPERIPVYMLLSPNLFSAIWWMGFLYSVYLVFMTVEFFFLTKENVVAARIAGAGGVLSAIAAHSTLGSVFGLMEPRPYWFGAFMPVYFILTAFLSGVATIILVTVASYRFTGRKMSRELEDLIQELGRILAFVLGIVIFFTAWKLIVGSYTFAPEYSAVYRYLLTGPVIVTFWVIEILLGLLLPLFILLYPRIGASQKAMLAPFLVMSSLFVGRYNMVITGQVVPVFQGLWEQEYVSYSARYVEHLIVLSALAACAFLYTLGQRKLRLD